MTPAPIVMDTALQAVVYNLITSFVTQAFLIIAGVVAIVGGLWLSVKLFGYALHWAHRFF